MDGLKRVHLQILKQDILLVYGVIIYIMNESWTKQTDRGTISVGFRKEFLKKIGPIWNLIPRVTMRTPIEEGTILFAMETSNCLHSIKSPLKGTIVAFNTQCLDKPDSIDENIWLYEVLPQKQKNEMYSL